MLWSATDPMHERVPCMGAYLRHMYPMTARCARCGLRRHTGATWGRRDRPAGLAGRQATPRAPPRGPHRTAAEVAAARLEANQAHPHWGPRQLLPERARRQPDLALPAPSPAGERCRRGHRHPGAAPLPAEAPPAAWPAAFTGPCRTGDGRYGSPAGQYPTDSAPLSRPGSAHACKSWSYARLYAPTAPAPCGYHSQPQADASRSYDERCGSSLAWRFLSRAQPF
jgi:hypothetical protein